MSVFDGRRKRAGGPVIVCMWENIGPTHDDRLRAAARELIGTRIIGIQWSAVSTTYEWGGATSKEYAQVSLFDVRAGERPAQFPLFVKLVRACLARDATHVFLCHHNEIGVELAAWTLRLAGKKVFLLIDSKFDDFQRSIWREGLKALWLLPYQGAIAGSRRSRDYLRFLGMRQDRVRLGYDSSDLERIRRLGGALPAPQGLAHAERDFTIIARLVEKKNLSVAIEAYALYAASVPEPRRLRICGSGPLEAELRAKVMAAGLDGQIIFEGFQQTDAICRILGSSLAVLLVSREEQFGFAIVESLALGVPVIVSDNCGARDEFVRSGVNGFVVEPDNAAGIAFYLRQLAEDSELWCAMAEAAVKAAAGADARHFAAAVHALTEAVG